MIDWCTKSSKLEGGDNMPTLKLATGISMTFSKPLRGRGMAHAKQGGAGNLTQTSHKIKGKKVVSEIKTEY